MTPLQGFVIAIAGLNITDALVGMPWWCFWPMFALVAHDAFRAARRLDLERAGRR